MVFFEVLKNKNNEILLVGADFMIPMKSVKSFVRWPDQEHFTLLLFNKTTLEVDKQCVETLKGYCDVADFLVTVDCIVPWTNIFSIINRTDRED